jgi:hypothetical protein
MIFDKTLLFSDAQAITGDAASTNVVDLGNTGTPYGGRKLVADFGKGKKIPLFVFVTANFNTLTSLTVSLQVDTVENFASPKEVASKTFLLAELTAGKELSFPDCILEGADERYIRLFYDVNGTNPTTGAITAGVVAARQTNFGRHF